MTNNILDYEYSLISLSLGQISLNNSPGSPEHTFENHSYIKITLELYKKLYKNCTKSNKSYSAFINLKTRIFFTQRNLNIKELLVIILNSRILVSKNTGVDCHVLLQRLFLTQGSNPGLPQCRQMLYPLSHQGSALFILRHQ